MHKIHCCPTSEALLLAPRDKFWQRGLVLFFSSSTKKIIKHLTRLLIQIFHWHWCDDLTELAFKTDGSAIFVLHATTHTHTLLLQLDHFIAFAVPSPDKLVLRSTCSTVTISKYFLKSSGTHNHSFLSLVRTIKMKTTNTQKKSTRKNTVVQTKRDSAAKLVRLCARPTAPCAGWTRTWRETGHSRLDRQSTFWWPRAHGGFFFVQVTGLTRSQTEREATTQWKLGLVCVTTSTLLAGFRRTNREKRKKGQRAVVTVLINLENFSFLYGCMV